MRNSLRTLVIGLVFISITLIFVQHIYEANNNSKPILDQLENKVENVKSYNEASSDEKYMSFFPHG